MKHNIRAMMKDSDEIIGEEAQLKAVKQNGLNIAYIDKPSEAVQLVAVNQNGSAIRYIEDPSEEVMQAALNENKNVIQYFKQSWLKNLSEVEEITVSELEKLLGKKIKIIAEE